MNERWETLDPGEQLINQAQPTQYHPTGLRQAREATGLHIAALAAALKVPVKKLEALEDARYDELPDLTFARALASSACRHLKVDSAPILEMIPHGNAPILGGTSASINTPFKPDGGTSLLAAFDGLKNPAFSIASLVLLAALGLAFLPDWNQWPGKEWLDSGVRWVQEIGRSEPATEAADSSLAIVTLTQPVEAEAADAPLATETSPLESSLAVLKSATGLTLTPSTSESPSGTVLRLEATSDSWVEVIDGEGKVQIQRVLRKGDVLDFSSSPPYSVVLGRSDVVAVQVRGQAFDVTPYARNSVARFQVR
jgi:cytoskeleton protein RodZ